MAYILCVKNSLSNYPKLKSDYSKLYNSVAKV